MNHLPTELLPSRLVKIPMLLLLVFGMVGCGPTLEEMGSITKDKDGNVVSVDIGYFVTDAGLEHLKGLTSLQILRLYGPQVTDAGIEHLKGLTSLSTLGLSGTNVTDAGREELKAALPRCRIQ